jgi:hypothetical protein
MNALVFLGSTLHWQRNSLLVLPSLPCLPGLTCWWSGRGNCEQYQQVNYATRMMFSKIHIWQQQGTSSDEWATICELDKVCSYSGMKWHIFKSLQEVFTHAWQRPLHSRPMLSCWRLCWDAGTWLSAHWLARKRRLAVLSALERWFGTGGTELNVRWALQATWQPMLGRLAARSSLEYIFKSEQLLVSNNKNVLRVGDSKYTNNERTYTDLSCQFGTRRFAYKHIALITERQTAFLCHSLLLLVLPFSRLSSVLTESLNFPLV